MQKITAIFLLLSTNFAYATLPSREIYVLENTVMGNNLGKKIHLKGEMKINYSKRSKITSIETSQDDYRGCLTQIKFELGTVESQFSYNHKKLEKDYYTYYGEVKMSHSRNQDDQCEKPNVENTTHEFKGYINIRRPYEISSKNPFIKWDGMIINPVVIGKEDADKGEVTLSSNNSYEITRRPSNFYLQWGIWREKKEAYLPWLLENIVGGIFLGGPVLILNSFGLEIDLFPPREIIRNEEFGLELWRLNSF